MARRNGPALYELMGKRGEGAADAPAPGARPPVLTAGQMQFATFAALALTIAVVSYLFGVARGERIGRESLLAEREEERQLLEQGRPSAGTPAAQPQAPASGNSAISQMNGGAVPSSAQPASEPPASATGDLGPQPVDQDPRQTGLAYFVLTTTKPAYAVPVVRFYRERGLDAWAVPVQNSRSGDVEVIVLPGFPEAERSSATVKDFESRIRRVGLLYKAAGRGNPDFADMFPKIFR